MNNNEHKSNKFFEGFFWGLIIGGAAVYLLGTKSGKKILKTLTEEGIGNISDLMGEEIEEYDELEEEPEAEVKKTNGNGVTKNATEEKKEKPSIRKRFFKRKS